MAPDETGQKRQLPWSLPQANAAAGVSFGSFGELLQGALPDHGDFLVTLPIEKHSVAHFSPSPGSDTLDVFPRWKTKSQQLAQRLLRAHNWRGGGRLYLASDIPCAKGLSSSSADLVATARAIEAHLGVEIPIEELCRTLSQIEPTDGVMFPECVTYLHLKGALLERLGSLARAEILSLDEGGQLRTLDYHRRRITAYTAAEQQRFAGLLDRLRQGFAQDNLDEIGAVATMSAYINHQSNPKQHLRLMHDVCKRSGGVGLVTTHSGTCLGILYDTTKPDHVENRERAASEVRGHGRVDVYTTIKPPLADTRTLDWSQFDQA